jgi:hypothetical protein
MRAASAVNGPSPARVEAMEWLANEAKGGSSGR